jgi:hypothetical protein
MDRLTERHLLAHKLDERQESRKNVNDLPDVIEARSKMDEARAALDEAQRDFNRVFNANYGRGDYDLIKAHPEAVVLGLDLEPEFRWIARCAVTKLPIFWGDKVYTIGNDDGSRVYILADLVQAPGFELEVIVLTQDNDDETF